MQQTVQQRGDAGSVGKDLVPFFKCSVGGHDHGPAFVTAIDDFIEDVRSFIVERQVGQFVDTSEIRSAVATQLASATLEHFMAQVFHDGGSGAKQNRAAR